MEISPASIAQVRAARNGKFVTIDDDVANIAASLRLLDPALHLRYSEAGGYFVVYQTLEVDGEPVENLVLTAQELDGRIIARVERIMHPSYLYADELEAQNAQAELDHAAELREQVSEIGQRLFHAARKDKGIT